MHHACSPRRIIGYHRLRRSSTRPAAAVQQWGKQTTPRPRQPLELTTPKRTHTVPKRQQTVPTRRPMTPTVGPLNYANKPNSYTAKHGLSVNAKPIQQTRLNPRKPA